jgi:hypothetical protein
VGLFSFIGGLIGGNKQAKAADKAAKLGYDANMAGIAETGRQFDATRSDFAPYQALGTAAAKNLGNLTGLNGDDAVQAEINRILSGSRYNSIFNNGRDQILANASATGGLRGGNTQDALARFGGDTLSDQISRQIAEYGGMVGIGTGAAGAVGQFGANAVSQQAGLRNQGADVLGQAALIRGGIAARNWQNLGGALDQGVSAALGGGGFNWKTSF